MSTLKSFFVCSLALICVFYNAAAQSPDSRICNCFAGPVSADFMLTTQAVFGTTSKVLRRDDLLRPQQSQLVKFKIPLLESKQSCKTWYSMYIADERGNKVYESASSNNEFNYSFKDCDKNYSVTLMAYSKSAAGGDGNCTRRLVFTVRPVCNTVVCNCFISKTTKPAISADLNISGTVDCLPTSGSQRKYVLRFDIINKTNCLLNVESILVHGQTVEVPPYNIAAGGKTSGISLGFATPLSQAPPAGSKLNIAVRYRLNEKKCAATMELPYITCR